MLVELGKSELRKHRKEDGARKMASRQKQKGSERTRKAATALLGQENGDAFQRSMALNANDGRAVLLPISLSALNTPSEHRRINILSKEEHVKKVPLEAFSPDFAAAEGKRSIDVFNNIADSVSSCTKDPSSSAAEQADHAKIWSNPTVMSESSIEESAHNNSTFCQIASSPRTISHFVAADIGSNIRTKHEQELCSEEKGEIICIKENDLDLIEHRKVGQSFISDADGFAGSSTGSSASYGSQGSEWFTPLNTRRELGSLAADSRQCVLGEKQMAEILSTKKTLFDMDQEPDGHENITPINDRNKGRESIGTEEVRDFPFDAAKNADLDEKHQGKLSNNQAHETVLHLKREGCSDLQSPLAGSQKDLCLTELEAQLEDEIYSGLEEEIITKISRLNKKLEDLQSQQKSRCSNELSSKNSPSIPETLSADKFLPPVTKFSPSMRKRRKSRVVSAKFLDWQRRSPAPLGSKSGKEKLDDSKLLTAGKSMTPTKQHGDAREILPTLKRRSMVASAVASNNGNLAKNVLSEKRETVKEKVLKSTGKQGAAKVKLAISEKRHAGEDLPTDQTCSMSPAFMLTDYGRRFDWVKSLRSGEIGAHGVSSKGKALNASSKCAAASTGCSKYDLQSVYSEVSFAIQPGHEAKEVSKRATRGKEFASRVSSVATATVHVKKATVLQTLTREKVERKAGFGQQNFAKHKHRVGSSRTTSKPAKIGTFLKPDTQKSCTESRKSSKPTKDSMQQPMCKATDKENSTPSTPSTTNTQTTVRNSVKEQADEGFTVEMDTGIQIQVQDRQELYKKEESGPECSSG